MSNPILRQIRDIQVQAQKLCFDKASLQQVQEFANYSKDLKNTLKNEITDEFIQSLISEIPELDAELAKTNKLVEGLLALAIGAISFITSEARKVNSVKPIIREIQGKYASIELLVKNADI